MLSILNTLKHTYAIWFYIDQLSATDVTILTSPKLVHTFGAAWLSNPQSHKAQSLPLVQWRLRPRQSVWEPSDQSCPLLAKG